MGISLSRLSYNVAFYNWLKKDRKDSSVRGYLSNYYYSKNSFKDYPTLDSCNRFIAEKQLEGRRGSYINHFVSVFRLYTQFLEETGKPFDPEVYKLKKVKEEAVNKATLSDSEIEAFLALPAPFNYRSHYELYTLFFSVLAYSGMRPTEVSHLRTDDIDFGRNIFILTDTKTNDSRFVPIAQNLLEPLKKRIGEIEEGAYLFPSARGGNNSGVGQVFDNVDWHYNFHTRLKRLGIKRRNLTCYSLRHSFITRLLAEDINIFKVQKIVGHRRIETTNAYTHLTVKDIQKAILKDPLYTRSNPKGKLDYIKEAVKSLIIDNPEKLRFTIDEAPNSFQLRVSIEEGV